MKNPNTNATSKREVNVLEGGRPSLRIAKRSGRAKRDWRTVMPNGSRREYVRIGIESESAGEGVPYAAKDGK